MRYCGMCDEYTAQKEKECKKCGFDTDKVPKETSSKGSRV
jgi:rRNA maturation protein Nop10